MKPVLKKKAKKKKSTTIPRLTPKQKDFADKFIEIGNATEAYKSAYVTDRMKPETINTEAKRTLRLPPVNDYINKRMKQIDEAKIPKQKEVLEFLGGVMRGTLKITVETDEGPEEIPPNWKNRIDAAKELLKRMPMDDPITQAQLRKLNAEATLAESRTNESQDKTGRMRRLISKMSDEDIKNMISNLESGDS